MELQPGHFTVGEMETLLRSMIPFFLVTGPIKPDLNGMNDHNPKACCSAIISGLKAALDEKLAIVRFGSGNWPREQVGDEAG